MFMHTYPFFSIFLFWVVMVCFVYLSISLSLSHSNRLCMAPKRESTPTQNPFHSRSSSSTNLPPLHVQFRDEESHQDFSKNFSKHGLHPEHHVILLNFVDTTLPNVSHTQGWESLCEIPLRCPIVFIQDFYSNMHGIDTSVPQFTTVV